MPDWAPPVIVAVWLALRALAGQRWWRGPSDAERLTDHYAERSWRLTRNRWRRR